MDIALLRSSFETIRPQAEEAARTFYAHLLGTYPQVRPLFAQTDFSQQRKKLMATLAAIVQLVDKPDELHPLLQRLGVSHEAYGVRPEMYAFVSASLLATLAGALGKAWTPELAKSWVEALEVVGEAMIAAQARAA